MRRAPVPCAAPIKIGVWEEMPAKPRTLSHVVCFVPDIPSAEAFYVKRLGFKVTDRFNGVGPFLRPAGTTDHHTLFFIQTPAYMKGCEHFAFHMGGPTELMLAGSRFMHAGYQSFWGPGRHKFGSNWFWYFNSPLGCHVEYDADMDQHDDEWSPREAPMRPEARRRFCSSTARAGRRAVRLRRRKRGVEPLMTRPDLAGRRSSRGRSARFWAVRRLARQSLRGAQERLLSSPIGTPARTMAARRWRGEATPISTPLGDRIVCASHGAEFEIETGLCVHGAALGLTL